MVSDQRNAILHHAVSPDDIGVMNDTKWDEIRIAMYNFKGIVRSA